jgi:hypothetical protein
VTGDGQEDLVYTAAMNQPDAVVGVLDPVSGATAVYPSYDWPQPIVLADLNCDGRKDVIAANGGYEAVTVFTQNTSGGLDGWVSYPGPYSNGFEPGALAVGDLNSDGLPDAAIVDPWNGLTVLLHTPQTDSPAPDVIAPVCSSTVTGTTGMGGWYVSVASVTLNASDEEGGSGLKGICVARDGGAWSPYVAAVTVSDQGIHTVSYYAEDNVGNCSAVQQVQVKIDTTTPSLSVQPAVTTIWPPNGQTVRVPVKVMASDSDSGISTLRLVVTDEYGRAAWERDTAPGATVNVPLIASRREKDLDGHTYTLTLTGVDVAGNQSVAKAAIVIPHAKPKAKKN